MTRALFLAVFSWTILLPLRSMASMPDAVSQHIAAMDSECHEDGGTPVTPEAGFLVSADLNGDGIPDWVLDEGKYICDGAWSIFSGASGSAQIVVFEGLPGGKARQSFENGADGAELKKRAGRAVLWLNVGGELCGEIDPPCMACAEECERPLIWDAKQQLFDWGRLSAIKITQAAQ